MNRFPSPDLFIACISDNQEDNVQAGELRYTLEIVPISLLRIKKSQIQVKQNR
jgi:hypothetical protein